MWFLLRVCVFSFFRSGKFIWIHYPVLYLIHVAKVFYLCLIRNLVTESIEKLPQPPDLFHIKLRRSFINILVFCNRIAVMSCSLFNLCAIVEIFENYQRGVDFFSLSFDIDRNEQFFLFTVITDIIFQQLDVKLFAGVLSVKKK